MPQDRRGPEQVGGLLGQRAGRPPCSHSVPAMALGADGVSRAPQVPMMALGCTVLSRLRARDAPCPQGPGCEPTVPHSCPSG